MQHRGGGAAFEHAPGEKQVGACVHARVARESAVFNRWSRAEGCAHLEQVQLGKVSFTEHCYNYIMLCLLSLHGIQWCDESLTLLWVLEAVQSGRGSSCQYQVTDDWRIILCLC